MGFKPTKEQEAFMRHDPSEHGRLHAGPGTGKSSTAIAYLKEVLQEPGTKRKVRFLTFTRSTMLELRRKIEAELGAARVKPSTIHSFAISTLLMNEGVGDFPRPLRIPDTFEREELIVKHVARMMHLRPNEANEFFLEMAAKWTRLSSEEWPKITPADRARFMDIWSRHRRVFGYTLLDEIPNQLREALMAHSDLVGAIIDLLLVDEYQDLNACDLQVLHLLAQRGATIIAIGDEDQSIYSFRRAHPAGIQAFLNDYKTSYDYPLSVCIRCSRRIMGWADSVIKGDLKRTARPELSFSDGTPEGEVALLRFPGGVSEATGCAKLIDWLIEAGGLPAAEILVLSRTDHNGTFTSRLREELAARSIGVSDQKAVERWMAETENRRAIALLRLLVFRQDSMAWWTLIDLQYGLGVGFLNYLYRQAVAEEVPFGEMFEKLAAAGFKGARSAQRTIALGLHERTVIALDAISLPGELERNDWGAWIVAQSEEGKLPAIGAELASLLARLDAALQEVVTLGRFLGQIEPMGKDLMLAEPGGVRIMNMMSSKGLTVRATIILGVDNDLIPRPGEDIDEERRLLYVAMTRSREFLFLTWCGTRQGPAARAGTENLGQRSYSGFLKGGPVDSEPGPAYVRRITRRSASRQPRTQV